MNDLKYYKKGEYTHMNKNAYEIRLDVLGMAHGTLMSKYHQKLDTKRVEAERAQAKFDDNVIDTLLPTTSDIIAYANELYQFVEGK
jgi:hypothetical protein